eukprot:TRINITY_DN7502_c0_g1_i1.p1 TRINITY_DN7502_c0_g1~~TRINITY_DN7502_c0_g1_i1.p1  ORF type:complete len:843 (+),score=183.65 TRINITY_DN7502_c0_g1_i1:179-2530(+)
MAQPEHQSHPPKRVPTIAVFTSGGDAPGMNAALRAIVRLGLHGGAKVFAIYEGYQGLVDGGSRIVEADWSFVGGILAEGGTKIGSARCQEFRLREGRLKAALNLITKHVDTLIVIGGDGSLTGADVFRKEWPDLVSELIKTNRITAEQVGVSKELTIIGLVGSIDNDMCGTEVTIGADSALHRIASAVDAVLSTAASHRRSFVVEVMGRDCGYLALLTGLATGADWVLLPESPPPKGWEEKMVNELDKGREMGRRCSLVIISEGSRQEDGTPITAAQVCAMLSAAGHDARVTILGHVQRGGTPSVYDRNMSTFVGAAAIEAAFNEELRGGSWLIGMQGHKVIRSPLMMCVERTREVPKVIAAKNFEEAVKMRGSAFRECFDILRTLHRLAPRGIIPHRAVKIGIMHVGALAPGMNATVRALVRLGLDSGHKMFGIINGFEGLVDDHVNEMNWMSVNGWTPQAGAHLGISRLMSKGKLEKVAATIKKYEFDAIVMVGGFDGYEGMLDLYNNREKYPEFNIGLLCVPATISNNCPGTETSVGADTSLNNIVEALDKIKESAVASKRVFVVEVMGSDCGYLALLSGLASGAERVYIPEEGMTLKTLQADVEELKVRFSDQKKNNLGLIIRNENANKTFDTDFVHSLLKEEGKGYFDVRQTILGHLQQGGRPSPYDRILAARLALHVIQFVDSNIAKEQKKNPDISAIFGVEDGEVKFYPMADLPKMTVPERRRPVHQWWMEFVPVLRILGQSGPFRVAPADKPTYRVVRTWTIPQITTPIHHKCQV